MIGAIVVTHNNATTITACLASLHEAGCQEIVVIDNASVDSTTRVGMPHTRLVRNATNDGFGAACNQGAAMLTTPYILFLNPDATLLPAALAHAETYLADHPRVAALGFQLVDQHGQPQPDNWGNEVTLRSLLWRHRFQRDPANGGGKVHPATVAHEVATCAWVSGAAMLVRRDAFMSVGGFDPGFFMYWEDVDVCRRLRDRGWKIVFMSQARVAHQRGHSTVDTGAKTTWYDQSADRYFRKHYATTIWLLQHFGRRLYRYLVPQVR